MSDMFDLETFARRFRIAIASENLTQAEAAEKIGIVPSIVSRICAVKGRPNIETHARIEAWLEKVERR